MIDVDEQLELIEHLDFELPCSVQVVRMIRIGPVTVPFDRPGPCGEAAVGTITCRACGRTGYVCEDHHVRVLGTPVITCATCLVTAVTAVLMFFTPLPSGGCER